MAINGQVAFFAVGFGVFIAFLGGSVISPPDPFTQVLVAVPLLLVVIPVVYRVLAADGIDELDESPSVPFPFLVASSVLSTLAAYVAGILVSMTPWPGSSVAIAGRGGAFLAVFLLVSWYTIRRSRDEPVDTDVGPSVE